MTRQNLKYVPAATVLSLICVLYASPSAFAQEAGGTTVTIPWGDTLSTILVGFQDTFTVTLLAVLSLVVARMPGWVTAIMGPAKIEQLLTKAIDYAIATTAGAVKGQELSMDVGNRIAARALRYAVEHGPGWLIEWAGGEKKVGEKIVARLPVAKDAALTPPR